MLSPDTSFQNNLSSAMAAATTVTNFAQATIAAVPEVSAPPDWFTPIQSDLDTSSAHASDWVETICPSVHTGVPQSIVDFNGVFLDASQWVINLLAEINAQPRSLPTAQQRAEVTDSLKRILDSIEAQQNAVGNVEKSIKQYSSDIKADQDRLQADLGVAKEKFTDSHVWVTQLDSILQDNFLNSNILGPCNAIVMIDLNVSLKVQGTGCDSTLITLAYAEAILENQISNSSQAQNSVQALVDLWATFFGKCQAVVSDLQDASDEDFASIMAAVDLATAQSQWKQLSDFAQTMMPN